VKTSVYKLFLFKHSCELW